MPKIVVFFAIFSKHMPALMGSGSMDRRRKHPDPDRCLGLSANYQEVGIFRFFQQIVRHDSMLLCASCPSFISSSTATVSCHQKNGLNVPGNGGQVGRDMHHDIRSKYDLTHVSGVSGPGRKYLTGPFSETWSREQLAWPA